MVLSKSVYYYYVCCSDCVLITDCCSRESTTWRRWCTLLLLFSVDIVQQLASHSHADSQCLNKAVCCAQSQASVKYCPVVRAQKQFLWDIISDDVSDLHTARWASDLAAYVHHTHTQSTALCPVLPRWAGTRNVRDSEWQWHQLGHICKSAPRSRQIAMPAPHHSVFTARCSASAVLAMGLCLCLSVRLSVTSWSSTKTV